MRIIKQLNFIYPVNGNKAFFILMVIWSLPLFAGAQIRQRDLHSDTVNLQGVWWFKADPKDEGIVNKWYNSKFTEQVKLPGSMTTNGKGDDITINTPWTGSIEDSSWFHKPQYALYRQPGKIKVPFWLQPVKYYKGAAWYQKTVVIPKSWQNRPIEFFIERAHWETTVYIDDKPLGMLNSLAAPHVYLINNLSPGLHRLSVRVDNRVKDIDVGINSHSITDHTQGNWNGMIGKLYMASLPQNYIEDVQLYPDIKKKEVVARIAIKSAGAATVTLKLQVFDEAKGKVASSALVKQIQLTGTGDTIRIIYPMVKNPKLWSEFHPALYQMKVTLSDGKAASGRNVLFGMREFSSKGTQFTINGHLTFLRGTLDCAAFPLTGYPPTDVSSWTKILKTCRGFGLNHIRFHSWCPPDAAFEAADRLGMYVQIECSSWANQGTAIGDGKPVDQYIYDESNRIVKAYGNHPSFCMMVYGNEPAGDHLTEYLTRFVKYWETKDPRRLYSSGSGWPIIPESNYNSTADPRIQGWGQGLKSIINSQPPSTDYNWEKIIAQWQHPTVSHEIGQWCVYPDFKEIPKYTGILKAKNFEIFRDQLDKNGLGAYAEKFLQASGRLQTLCYKADIEAALRTKGFGGFQLLGLEDFPGQGTALVGVLNAFYQPKDYITATEYHSFCNAVVPMAMFPKMVYLNNETLSIPVEIAQFTEGSLWNVSPSWQITDAAGKVLHAGRFKIQNIPAGNGLMIGEIRQSLSGIQTPSRLKLKVMVGSFQNSWEFFVYPARQPEIKQKLLITDHLDNEIIKKLNNGAKVLLTIKKGSLKAQFGGDIAIGFSSIFWNTAWTNGQPPVTLGIWCDPQHPALKYFPTENHSNYQWWDAMTHSSPILLDSVKSGIKPIVRVIDDWVTARSLGLLLTVRCGKGKLLVSGIDLLSTMEKRPWAKQLLYSLERYMASPAFDPKDKVDADRVANFIR